MAQQTTLEELNSVYPKLEEALLEHARSYKLPQEQLDWYKKASLSRSEAIPKPLPKLTLSEVSRGQPSRRKMQPRHVRPRLGLPYPREASF